MNYITKLYSFSILLIVLSFVACDNSIVDISKSDYYVKFLSDSEDLISRDIIETSEEEFLILATKDEKEDINVIDYGNQNTGSENLEHVLIHVDSLGNLINKKDFPYKATHIKLYKNADRSIVIFGLAKQGSFFEYDWEDQKLLNNIKVPYHLFFKIESNTLVKYYPKYKKILFNVFEWNEETQTNDMILVLMDFNSNYKTYTFPNKRISKEVLMDWIWDPDAGKCKGGSYADCQSSQRRREIIDDVYVSYYDYIPDGNILVVYDSIRYGFFNRVSARTGIVWEENYKTLKFTKIDQNGTVLETFLLPTSPDLRTFLLPTENNYLIFAAPVQYSWEETGERYLDQSYGLKELFQSYEQQLNEFNYNLDLPNSYLLELDDISNVNEFHSMKMTHDGEIMFLYKNTIEQDGNVKLIVIKEGNVIINFEYGTFVQNEYCVDVIKTTRGGYAILANIMLDGHNLTALIRLNEYGEITF